MISEDESADTTLGVRRVGKALKPELVEEAGHQLYETFNGSSSWITTLHYTIVTENESTRALVLQALSFALLAAIVAVIDYSTGLTVQALDFLAHVYAGESWELIIQAVNGTTSNPQLILIGVLVYRGLAVFIVAGVIWLVISWMWLGSYEHVSDDQFGFQFASPNDSPNVFGEYTWKNTSEESVREVVSTAHDGNIQLTQTASEQNPLLDGMPRFDDDEYEVVTVDLQMDESRVCESLEGTEQATKLLRDVSSDHGAPLDTIISTLSELDCLVHFQVLVRENILGTLYQTKLRTNADAAKKPYERQNESVRPDPASKINFLHLNVRVVAFIPSTNTDQVRHVKKELESLRRPFNRAYSENRFVKTKTGVKSAWNPLTRRRAKHVYRSFKHRKFHYTPSSPLVRILPMRYRRNLVMAAETVGAFIALPAEGRIETQRAITYVAPDELPPRRPSPAATEEITATEFNLITHGEADGTGEETAETTTDTDEDQGGVSS